MASSVTQSQQGNLDRYCVIHVATTCDEHGVYVTKDSAEVIELGWILLDAADCKEVRSATPFTTFVCKIGSILTVFLSFSAKAFLSSPSTHRSLLFAVSGDHIKQSFSAESFFTNLNVFESLKRPILTFFLLQLA